MQTVTYRALRTEEIDRALFRDFRRRQVVTKCWRRDGEAWVIRDDPFVDDWIEADYAYLVTCLRQTLLDGGFVYAAFVGETLRGFCAVKPGFFGGEQRYLDLASIHVSEELRGRGIGGALGEGTGRAEALHLRALGGGEPVVLPQNGLCGGTGLRSCAREAGAL